MTQGKSVLELTTRIGEVLLKNGGEIFRVQQTMQIVAKAYGVSGFHVYVLANGLFVSIEEDGKQLCSQVGAGTEPAEPVVASQIRHVPLSSVHLGRVAAVNNLSREIAAHKYTVEQAKEKIEQIDQIPFTSNALQVLVSGVGAGAFCYLFGGALLDSVAAFPIGFLLQIYLFAAQKRHSAFMPFLTAKGANKIMVNILSSALVTAMGVLFFHVLFGDNMDMIVIGSIVPLLPGVPLTNSIRDFLNGDYLSGTIRMIDAVLVACCIALGVGIVLSAFQMLTGITLL